MSNRDQIDVELDLLRKYDQPGPRYTSYPTIPFFHEGVREKEYLHHLKFDDRFKNQESISLYFHLPFCDTLCYFCGCNMMVVHDREKIDTYLDYLLKEMALLRPLINPARKVRQLHWGGGSPTSLSPEQIIRLGEAIRFYFEFDQAAEIGVEIDPRGLTRAHMEALAEVGFNRCSIGVQDFNPQVQQTVNRIQSAEITRRTVAWARELSFHSVNIDLIYGLPFQTVDSFAKTLDIVLDLKPDRLAVFSYAHLPQLIKHQRLIKDEWLPEPKVKLELLKLSIEKLTCSGYVYIGMDHFAKPDDELARAMKAGTLYRNFQGYSTHAGLNLISFGITSISMLSNIYVQNFKKLTPYYQQIDSGHLPIFRGVVLNKDDRLRREVITKLMCHFHLEKSDIENKYNLNFDQYFAKALKNLEEMEADGLIELHPERLKVTTRGRLFIRNIAMQFDAYLPQTKENKPKFSRTI
jgi:oxygen-independent coproporphyrinogen-3 oxidase